MINLTAVHLFKLNVYEHDVNILVILRLSIFNRWLILKLIWMLWSELTWMLPPLGPSMSFPNAIMSGFVRHLCISSSFKMILLSGGCWSRKNLWALGWLILVYPPMQGPVGKGGRDKEDAQQKGKIDVISYFCHHHPYLSKIWKEQFLSWWYNWLTSEDHLKVNVWLVIPKI